MIFGGAALARFLRKRKELGSFTTPGLVDLFPKISDTAIGVTAAVMMLLMTGTKDGQRRPLLTWTEARTIPWDSPPNRARFMVSIKPPSSLASPRRSAP